MHREEGERSERHAAICEKTSQPERNAERNYSKLDRNILKPICTSTPKKRCLDLCDSDTSSVDLGSPSKRWVDLNDSNSSELCSDITPIKEVVTETSPKHINQSVWIDILDSDDDIEETIRPFDAKGKLLIRRALSIVMAYDKLCRLLKGKSDNIKLTVQMCKCISRVFTIGIC